MINNMKEVLYSSLQVLGAKISEGIAGVIGAILMILFGWILARILSRVVSRLLKVAGFDKLGHKLVDESVIDIDFKSTPSKIVGRVFYWVVILIFIVTAAEVLGWDVVSREVSKLILYLPKLFAAVIIFLIGFYIANFIRQALSTTLKSAAIKSASAISSIAFYIILVIISITALSQAGLDTGLLTSNVTLIIGAVMLAFAIAFGFAARPILQSILAGMYTKPNFSVGDVITLDGLKGEIVKIDNLFIVIQHGQELTTIPVKEVLENRVTVVKSSS